MSGVWCVFVSGVWCVVCGVCLSVSCRGFLELLTADDLEYLAARGNSGDDSSNSSGSSSSSTGVRTGLYEQLSNFCFVCLLGWLFVCICIYVRLLLLFFVVLCIVIGRWMSGLNYYADLAAANTAATGTPVAADTASITPSAGAAGSASTGVAENAGLFLVGKRAKIWWDGNQVCVY